MSPLLLLTMVTVPAFIIALRPTRRQRAAIWALLLRLRRSQPARDLAFAARFYTELTLLAFALPGIILGLWAVATR